MNKRDRSNSSSSSEEMQTEKPFPHPEGELFVFYKQFMQYDGRWPQRKLRYLACPFCVLQPELYKGVKNSACQGWGSHDISALRDHVHGHLPENEKAQQPSLTSTLKDAVKTQDDIPRICQSRVESWRKMKSARKRPRKGVQQEWWDIANVALGAKIPEPLPDDVHLSFCTGFSAFRDFWEYCHGGKVAERPADLASPRHPKAHKTPSVTELTAMGDYSIEELNYLVRNRPDDGATYVPAPEQADSAYHGSLETYPLTNAFLGSLQLTGYSHNPYSNDLDISDSDSTTAYDRT